MSRLASGTLGHLCRSTHFREPKLGRSDAIVDTGAMWHLPSLCVLFELSLISGRSSSSRTIQILRFDFQLFSYKYRAGSAIRTCGVLPLVVKYIYRCENGEVVHYKPNHYIHLYTIFT